MLIKRPAVNTQAPSKQYSFSSKPLVLFVLLIFGVLGLNYSTLYAANNIYYVAQLNPLASDTNPGTQNLPWRTLQHAVAEATPGTVIIVSPGEYGRVTIEMSGLDAGDGQIVVRSERRPVVQFNQTNAELLNSSDTAVTQGFIIRGNYIKIDGFEVSNIGANNRGAFYIDGAEYIEIVNNYVHELNCTNGNYGAIRGNQSSVTEGVVIRNNIMWRVEGITIAIPLSAVNWLIEGNDISHGTDLTPEGVKVCGDADAIRPFGHGHIIRDNYIHDFLRSEGTQGIGEPHMDCFQTYSVNGEQAYDIFIEANTCDNIGAQFVMFEDHPVQNNVHHIRFVNNIFTNAQGATAVNVRGCDYLEFVHNIVAYSGRGLRLRDGAHHSRVFNNIFYYNRSAALLNEDEASLPGTEWDFNMHYPFVTVPIGYEYDQHALITIDPMFVNPESGDYHINADSPAINGGQPLNDVVNDKDGISRPHGSGWDIGPYEYTESVGTNSPNAPQNLKILNP